MYRLQICLVMIVGTIAASVLIGWRPSTAQTISGGSAAISFLENEPAADQPLTTKGTGTRAVVGFDGLELAAPAALARPAAGQPPTASNSRVWPGSYGYISVGNGTVALVGSDSLSEAERVEADRSRELVAKYREATESVDREKIESEITKAVEKQFDVRQARRTEELKQLEAQLRRLMELHNRRENEKNQIVSDRVRQLLRDAEGLGWGGQEAPSASRLAPTATANPFQTK